jgi:hypothetical protein
VHNASNAATEFKIWDNVTNKPPPETHRGLKQLDYDEINFLFTSTFDWFTFLNAHSSAKQKLKHIRSTARQENLSSVQ